MYLNSAPTGNMVYTKVDDKPYKYAARCTIAETTVIFSALVNGFVGLSMLGIGVKTFIRKMISYSYFMDLKIDTTFFILVGGSACIPIVYVSLLIRRNQLKHVLIFLILNVSAIALLFTGYFLGTTYQLHYSNETLRLGSTIPTEPLNNTLFNIIANRNSYEEGTENHNNMDKIHYQFNCCGVRGVVDYAEVPGSCCLQQNCTENEPYDRGCLRRIQEDVAWHKNVTLSITQLLLLMYFFNMAMIMSVFISDHYKWKMLMRDGMRRR